MWPREKSSSRKCESNASIPTRSSSSLITKLSQLSSNILRACQSCRASKVRCDQPNPGMPCVRCQRAGKACVDATSQPGKRHRELNDRILEIESRIELMLSSAELRNSAGDNSPSIGKTVRSHNTQQHGQHQPMGSPMSFSG
jgi:hypothetical protein